MRKLVIRSGTGRPVRDNPQVLPPESRPQTVIHVHAAQPARTEEPASGCAGYVLAVLLPAIGFIVGIVFLCLPGRVAQGLRIILLSILSSTLYYFIVFTFLSRPIP